MVISLLMLLCVGTVSVLELTSAHEPSLHVDDSSVCMMTACLVGIHQGMQLTPN